MKKLKLFQIGIISLMVVVFMEGCRKEKPQPQFKNAKKATLIINESYKYKLFFFISVTKKSP